MNNKDEFFTHLTQLLYRNITQQNITSQNLSDQNPTARIAQSENTDCATHSNLLSTLNATEQNIFKSTKCDSKFIKVIKKTTEKYDPAIHTDIAESDIEEITQKLFYQRNYRKNRRVKVIIKTGEKYDPEIHKDIDASEIKEITQDAWNRKISQAAMNRVKVLNKTTEKYDPEIHNDMDESKIEEITPKMLYLRNYRKNKPRVKVIIRTGEKYDPEIHKDLPESAIQEINADTWYKRMQRRRLNSRKIADTTLAANIDDEINRPGAAINYVSNYPGVYIPSNHNQDDFNSELNDYIFADIIANNSETSLEVNASLFDQCSFPAENIPEQQTQDIVSSVDDNELWNFEFFSDSSQEQAGEYDPRLFASTDISSKRANSIEEMPASKKYKQS